MVRNSFLQFCFASIYWGIVYLQYCISFRFTAKWISYTYTHYFSYVCYYNNWVDFPVLPSRSLLIFWCIYSGVYVLNLSLPTDRPPMVSSYSFCIRVAFSFLKHFFHVMATPMAYASSGTRDWIHAAAATYTTSAATSDPLTHSAGPGVEPAPWQRPKLLQSDS